MGKNVVQTEIRILEGIPSDGEESWSIPFYPTNNKIYGNKFMGRGKISRMRMKAMMKMMMEMMMIIMSGCDTHKL